MSVGGALSVKDPLRTLVITFDMRANQSESPVDPQHLEKSIFEYRDLRDFDHFSVRKQRRDQLNASQRLRLLNARCMQTFARL